MSIERLIVAITGTPCTGKSTFAKRLAGKRKDATVIEINDIVERDKLYSGKDRFGSKIVKISRLNAALAKDLRKRRGLVIVVGHLVPELRIGQRITVVLRTGLKTLLRRMKARGYPKGKIDENLSAEALDYCGVNSARRSAELYEIESAKDRDRIADYILEEYKGTARTKPRTKSIDKMPELLRLIMDGYTL